MPKWHFLIVLDSDEYQFLGITMIMHVYHVLIIGYKFYTLFPMSPLLISSFLSLLLLDSFVYLWQKGGEYTREYTRVNRHFYMTHVHILREKNSTSCTFVGGESHREDTYTKGKNTFFFRKPCFVLFCFTLCLFSRCFMVLWVTFSIYALLLSSHRVYVLDMQLIFALVLIALRVRMIIY